MSHRIECDRAGCAASTDPLAMFGWIVVTPDEATLTMGERLAYEFCSWTCVARYATSRDAS